MGAMAKSKKKTPGRPSRRPPAGAPSGTKIGLPPCPRTPNCVSTESADPRHRSEPIAFSGSGAEARERLLAVLAGMRGAKVVEDGGGRVRVEFTTPLFRYVDDVDLLIDEKAGKIRFRSASRKGHWDLGVNRRRMEQVRRRFARAEAGRE
jgi:uncharacterized protein (DUF1499 family)